MVFGIIVAAAAVAGIVHHQNKKKKLRRAGACNRQYNDMNQQSQYRDDVKGPANDYYAPRGGYDYDVNASAPMPAPPSYDQRWPNEYRGSAAGDNKVQMREAHFDDKSVIRREKSLREI